MVLLKNKLSIKHGNTDFSYQVFKKTMVKTGSVIWFRILI